MPDCQPGTTIENLSRLSWLMFRKISLLQIVKRFQYQSIIWNSTKEPIPTIQMLENHVGDEKVTLMFLSRQDYLQFWRH